MGALLSWPGTSAQMRWSAWQMAKTVTTAAQAPGTEGLEATTVFATSRGWQTPLAR
jgi:hypothetical protein